MARIIGEIALSLILLVGLAPLAEGLLRKLKAIIHSRQGPPIIQPHLDLGKMLVRRTWRRLRAGSGAWRRPSVWEPRWWWRC